MTREEFYEKYKKIIEKYFHSSGYIERSNWKEINYQDNKITDFKDIYNKCEKYESFIFNEDGKPKKRKFVYYIPKEGDYISDLQFKIPRNNETENDILGSFFNVEFELDIGGYNINRF